MRKIDDGNQEMRGMIGEVACKHAKDLVCDISG